MNKILTLLVIAFAFVNANAQTSIIKTSPLSLAFGNFNACYEKTTGEKTAFEVSGNFYYKLLGVDVSGGGLGIGYKFYVTRQEAPRGFYIEPEVGYSIGSADDLSYNSIGLGALLGYQLIGDSGFTFDIGVGPNYNIYGGDFDDIGFDSTGGFGPSIKLAVGYAW